MGGVRALIVAGAILAAPLPVLAESIIAGGDAAVGWPVYDASGQLGFAGCDGATRQLSDGGSFQATDKTCPKAPAPYRLKGKVSAIAPERSRLELQDEKGVVHMLYMTTAAAQELSKLQPDATVEVQGPVPGHADKVAAGP